MSPYFSFWNHNHLVQCCLSHQFYSQKIQNIIMLYSQVGFLKKPSFKGSCGILLVFSPAHLFTLFQGRWIQQSMLAIRKMSFNVTKWRTNDYPKTTFENKPYSALFINGPYESRNVGIKLYIRYQLFICLCHMVLPPRGWRVAVSGASIYCITNL
jgi:hypothetical protein